MAKISHTGSDCPMTRLVGLISSKWAMPVIYNLLMAEGPVRFGELKTAVGRITQRELSRTLKRFESAGLVKRKVYAEVPLRVEYSLTPLGRSLRDPFVGLARWAEKHAGQLAQAEKRRSNGSGHR